MANQTETTLLNVFQTKHVPRLITQYCQELHMYTDDGTLAIVCLHVPTLELGIIL